MDNTEQNNNAANNRLTKELTINNKRTTEYNNEKWTNN